MERNYFVFIPFSGDKNRIRKKGRKKKKRKEKMIKIQASQASTRKLAPRVPRLGGGRDEGKMRGGTREERRNAVRGQPLPKQQSTLKGRRRARTNGMR